MSSSGEVSALTAGQTTISAQIAADSQFQAATVSYTLTVLRISQTLSVTNAGPVAIDVGSSASNVATGQGSGAVSYSSSDTNIATVNSTGNVSALAAGSVTITAAIAEDSTYNSASTSYTVNANRIAQTFTFANAGPVAINVGSSASNVATGQGSGAVTYSSSDTNIATVNSSGNVSALTAGSVTITALIAEDSTYNSATTSYTVNTNRIAQTIAFADAGPLKLFVGDTASNVASGGAGSGATSYASSDTAIATVDASGQITLHAAGTATITATKAADTTYATASTNYGVDVVEKSFVMSGWIGATETDVSFSSGTDGVEFYRSSEANCDLANYNSCANGQLDILNDAPVTDSAALLAQVGYYTFKHGSAQVSTPIAFERWSERLGSQVVAFNNQLWVIGGNDVSASNKNDVWSSSDGIVWTQQTASAGFSARHSHQVAVFNNQLWVIGGIGSTLKNDVWSSTDRITWTQQTANAGFSARYSHQVSVFNNQLWVIGGRDGRAKNDVWSSNDGITWTQQTASADFSARYDHKVTVFNNQLWLIGGQDGARKNDVWSSTDGITWTQQTASAGFSARAYTPGERFQ